LIKRRLLLSAVLALAVVAGGCGDSSGTTTAAVDASGDSAADDVAFGSGELPETIPADFPLPPGSAIGSTMVITSSGFTEAIVRVGAELEAVVGFFDQELGSAGFEIEDSSSDGSGWLIRFDRDGATGTVEVTEPQPGLSQVIVRYNVP
jgi:hypothetical protein